MKLYKNKKSPKLGTKDKLDLQFVLGRFVSSRDLVDQINYQREWFDGTKMLNHCDVLNDIREVLKKDYETGKIKVKYYTHASNGKISFNYMLTRNQFKKMLFHYSTIFSERVVREMIERENI